MKRVATLVSLLLLVAALAACGDGGNQSSEPPTSRGTAPPAHRTRVVRVVAATRLERALNELIDAYLQEQDEVGIDASFDDPDRSGQLVASQSVDVIIHSTSTVGALAEAGRLAGTPLDFGSNPVQIIVPTGNPGNVTGVEAFGDTPTVTALCNEDLECGIAARAVLATAGVTPVPDRTGSGTEVLTLVRNGEVQATMMPRMLTPTSHQKGWQIVPIPVELQPPSSFQIAAVKTNRDVDGFIFWLQQSARANEILVDNGLR